MKAPEMDGIAVSIEHPTVATGDRTILFLLAICSKK
jgi:hypothetical protein